MAELGHLSLRRRKLRRDLIAVSGHLKEGLRKQSQTQRHTVTGHCIMTNGGHLQQSQFWLSTREGSSVQGDPGISTLESLLDQHAACSGFEPALPEQELGPCAPWSPSSLSFSLCGRNSACVDSCSTESLAAPELFLKPIFPWHPVVGAAPRDGRKISWSLLQQLALSTDPVLI